MKVEILDRQDALAISSTQVETLVKAFLKWKGVSTDEVILHFVSREEITALHGEIFNDPTPTDCMTFPIDPPNVDEGGSHLLGELFVCPGVALDHAQTHQCDPYEEVSLYIIHALLHLLGFRDQTDEERSVMRGEEKSAIDYLKKHEQLLHH